MSTEHLDTEDQKTFRLKARTWLQGRLPPRIPGEPAMDWEDKALVDRDRAIQRTLWDGGLAGIMLPAAYGGLGLSKRFSDIFYEEATPYRLPWHFGNAFNVVLPVLIAHASEALKKRYVPGILKGEQIWCQLLSEPSGGSDLAGVLTRAEKRNGKCFLNGSKVWTTGGIESDMGMCLARTDPTLPKHAGLTMFALDMHAPGVTVTKLRLIRGNSDFAQEFLDDVEIPEDHVIGEVNAGWTVAATQLANERAGMARGWHEGVAAAVEASEITPRQSYLTLAQELDLADDPLAREIIGELIVIDAVYELTTRRVGNGMRSRSLPPTIGGVPSLMAARTDVRRTALLSALTGPTAVAAADPSGLDNGFMRVCTHRIGGGTTEMQLNSVAERFLNLPREPGPDRDIPFNQLRHNTLR